MRSRVKRSFRPGAEGLDERCLTTVQAWTAGLGVQTLAAPRHHEARVPNPALRHPRALVQPGTGPNGGLGLIRLGLPSSFLDYGVVTLWNNTRTTAAFSVSASTFRNGQFYPFLLRPGQVQSFFAPVVNGNVPQFLVRFPANPRNAMALPLPYQNIVFESPSYLPSGTAGWPYAIGYGVNGYSIKTI